MCSARVVAKHSSDAAPVGCRCLRSELQPVGSQVTVKLSENHSGFNSHPSLSGIKLQDMVEIPRNIHNNPRAYNLAGQGGACASRYHGAARVSCKCQDLPDIGDRRRPGDSHRYLPVG